MIRRLIEFSLRHRLLIVAAYVALAGWGWWALTRTPIDAIPDLSDNQVIVFTDWTGHSPQEVEDQVTYPLTVNLQGLPGVRVVQIAVSVRVLDDLCRPRRRRRSVLRTDPRT